MAEEEFGFSESLLEAASKGPEVAVDAGLTKTKEGVKNGNIETLLETAETTPADGGEEVESATETTLDSASVAVEKADAGPKPSLHEIKDKLIELTSESTTERKRKALVLLLEEEGVVFDEDIEKTEGLEGTKARVLLKRAVEAVEDNKFGENEMWKTKEEAIEFLDEECNIEPTVVVQEQEVKNMNEDAPPDESEKTKIERVLAAHEIEFVNLFFNEFDNERFGNNVNNINDLLTAIGNTSDEINETFDRFRDQGEPVSMFSEIFEAIQNEYFNHVLGPDYLENLEKVQGIILKEEEKIKKNIDGHGTKAHVDRLRAYREGEANKLSSFIKKVASPINIDANGNNIGGRGWGFNEEIGPTNYLERRFGLVETVSTSSGVEAVIKILGVDYLSRDPIRGENRLRNRIDADIANKELLGRIVRIHDFTIRTELDGFKPEEMSNDEKTNINDALWDMLSLKKGEISIVPTVISVYDSVLRDFYDDDGKAISIDDERVLGEVSRRLGYLFDTSEEARLFIKMGRDVCRITGLDAQYGWDKNIVRGVDKQSLELTEKGSFFRGLLNFNKSLNRYEKDVNLMRGIELGVVPFWYSLRDKKEIIVDGITKKVPDDSPLSVSEIERFLTTKMKKNTTAFGGWFGQLKTYSEVMGAEGEFMDTISGEPTLEKFNSKLLPACMKLLQYTPDRGRAYLLNRLGGYVDYKKTYDDGGKSLIDEFKAQYITKEGTFKKDKLFENQKQLNDFLMKFGFITPPLDAVGGNVAEATTALRNLTGQYGERNQKEELKKDGLAALEFLGTIGKAFSKWGGK